MATQPYPDEYFAPSGSDKLYGNDLDLSADQGFSSTPEGHLSSPLGELKGVDSTSTYVPPKRIPANRRLRLTADHFRNSKTGSVRTNDDRINSWLIRLGLDYLNRSFHEFGEARSIEDVSSHLFTILIDRVPVTTEYEAFMNGESFSRVITVDRAIRYAGRAAQFACAVWSPTFYARQAARGRKGGLKSKRKPTYTRADFERVQGLTVAEAAQVLRTSESTVKRMRRRFKSSAPDPHEFDHLLGD